MLISNVKINLGHSQEKRLVLLHTSFRQYIPNNISY